MCELKEGDPAPSGNEGHLSGCQRALGKGGSEDGAQEARITSLATVLLVGTTQGRVPAPS